MYVRPSRFVSSSRLVIIADQLLVSGYNFIVILLAVRIFGLELFGVYATHVMVALLLSTFIMSLLVLPLNSISTKLSTKRMNSFACSVTALIALIHAILSILLGACLIFFDDGNYYANTLTIFSFVYFNVFFPELCRRICFIKLRTLSALCFDVLRVLLHAVAIVVFWNEIGVNGIVSFASIQAVTIVVGAVPIAWGAFRALHTQKVMTVQSVAEVRRIARVGWPLATANLMMYGAEFFPSWLLGFQGNSYAVGQVRAAQGLVGALNPLMYAIEHIVPAHIAKAARKSNQKAVISIFLNLAKLSILFSIAVFAIFYVTFDWLNAIVYGADNKIDSAIFFILLSAFCFQIFKMLSEFYARYCERTSGLMYFAFLGSAAVLIPSYFLVHLYGATGAAISVAALKFTYFAVYTLYSTRIR